MCWCHIIWYTKDECSEARLCLTLCNSMGCSLPASYTHGISQARILERVNRRPWFDPWVGKIPWRREWLPTSVFWPGEFHGLYSSVISVQFSHSVVSHSLFVPHGLQHTRLPCPSPTPRACSNSCPSSRTPLRILSLFLPPGNLPDPGMEPASLASPASAGGFCTTRGSWKTPYKR